MRLLGARRFRTTPDGHNETDIIKRVDAPPDEELSSEFMAFEGNRQLPPIQASHADIASRGNGRYSVFNQTFLFSPSHPSRSKSLYWILRRTPRTAPYLQMDPSIGNAPEPVLSWDRVREYIASATEGDGPFTLRPGDPVVVCTHGLPPRRAQRLRILHNLFGVRADRRS